VVRKQVLVLTKNLDGRREKAKFKVSKAISHRAHEAKYQDADKTRDLDKKAYAHNSAKSIIVRVQCARREKHKING